MFVPLHDENTLKSIRFQYVTLAIIAINVVIYLLEATRLDDVAIASFAIIPSELFDTSLFPLPTEAAAPAYPERLTLLTYMFFHGDILHLAGNMLFLWVFGDNVEDALGHIKFLIFYLACGVAGGLLHAWVEPTSGVPLIGASGAVAGVIAAYLMLHPRVRVWVLALKAIPLRISAAFALGIWILIQVVMVFLPQVGPTAWWAHIGGLLAGAVLVVFLRRPGVRLFDRGLGYGT
jgi:membrane associated rhomboid family serine protease